ncbi:glycosyltransferase family 2 protein [Xanthobacteraceae bacterium Astr-EGSB]|uniref:glycosyltransferase family 2 protein n=1 Tax=Astrobacterium formosum TaxID=3069710 RepID=UPI0027B0B3E5|nr:glycosyltransferase family 2 protein [Xanthobacteraceae bacterium Astr-EGSB]
MISFSVITATLDRKEMVLAAVESVRAQAYPDVEIIVADGGSRDGTVETLEACADIRLLRGPDRGVYDAWNKAIAHAHGDVVVLLNSDDCLPDGTLMAVADAFAAHPEVDAVCGCAELATLDGRSQIFDDEGERAMRRPETAFLGACVINARFFRRSAMLGVGPFDLRYRFIADRDWLVRWFTRGLMTHTIDHLVYRYRQHPGSLTFDANRRHREAIYAELLMLGRGWRREEGADPAVRAAAMDLEGRCLGRMTAAAVRKGRISQAVRLMFGEDGIISSMPIRCINTAIRRRWISPL